MILPFNATREGRRGSILEIPVKTAYRRDSPLNRESRLRRCTPVPRDDVPTIDDYTVSLGSEVSGSEFPRPSEGEARLRRER